MALAPTSTRFTMASFAMLRVVEAFCKFLLHRRQCGALTPSVHSYDTAVQSLASLETELCAIGSRSIANACVKNCSWKARLRILTAASVLDTRRVLPSRGVTMGTQAECTRVFPCQGQPCCLTCTNVKVTFKVQNWRQSVLREAYCHCFSVRHGRSK